MVATVVSATLMWLSVLEMKKQNEQMRQQYEDEKEERLLRYDRESIQKFIDTYLTIPSLSDLVEYSDDDTTYFFYNTLDSLILLNKKVQYTKYSYLFTYIQEITAYIETRYEENNKYSHHYRVFLLFSIDGITEYMHKGEEYFNAIWKEDFEGMKNILNKGIGE